MIFERHNADHGLFWKRAHPLLQHVARTLDTFSCLLCEINPEWKGEDGPEIVITSFWRGRKEGRPSFHPKFQAIDMRIKDREVGWRVEMVNILGSLHGLNTQIQFQHRLHGTGPHLHIEIDDGEPV